MTTPPNRVQIWATAHPLRLRIVELLRAGPATASQLGRRLGESSGTTSYHLRLLADAGWIVDAPELGTRRERWWRRRDETVLIPTDADPEGRLMSARLLGIYFARDAEARRRFVTEDVPPNWHEAAFAGNWFVPLTPAEAAELGQRLLATIDELRARRPPGDAEQTLVSLSVLPWLGDAPPG
jgi:DNA-binding transcriptional ArsR family regulator